MHQVKTGKTEQGEGEAASVTFLHAMCNEDRKTREVSELVRPL